MLVTVTYSQNLPVYFIASGSPIQKPVTSAGLESDRSVPTLPVPVAVEQTNLRNSPSPSKPEALPVSRPVSNKSPIRSDDGSHSVPATQATFLPNPFTPGQTNPVNLNYKKKRVNRYFFYIRFQK